MAACVLLMDNVNAPRATREHFARIVSHEASVTASDKRWKKTWFLAVNSGGLKWYRMMKSSFETVLLNLII
jgi:hypothetical protein